MSKVRIKLQSIDIEKLNEVIERIREIANNSGIPISGPIPLPTKKLKVTTRKSLWRWNCKFDRFEMRINKRVIDIASNDKVLHSIMRISIPRQLKLKLR